MVAVQSALNCPPALRTTSAAVRQHDAAGMLSLINHYVGKHAHARVCTIWGGYTEQGMVIGSVIVIRGAMRTPAEGLKLIFVGEEEQKTGGSVAHL